MTRPAAGRRESTPPTPSALTAVGVYGVHVLNDASHWVVEEAHERILPLLRDFLARHPLAPSSSS